MRWCSVSGPTSSSAGKTTTIIVKVTTPAWARQNSRKICRPFHCPRKANILRRMSPADANDTRCFEFPWGWMLARTEGWFVIPDGNRSKVTPRHDKREVTFTSNESRDIKNSLECDKWHDSRREGRPGVEECMFWEISSLKYVKKLSF